MGRSSELIAVICSIIGAVEISYVESRIIAKTGTLKCHADSLMTIYWRLLSVPERCLFWTGMPMLVAPFVLALAG